MTDHGHTATRFLIPGFAQTAGAWKPVLDGVDGAQALEIPAGMDFVATADALAIRRTGIWGGYSLGGRLALQIAVDHPGQVSGLLLASTTPGIIDGSERSARYRLDRELAIWITQHTVDEFLDRWLVQPVFGEVDRPRDHRLETAAQIAQQLETLGQGAQRPLWGQLGSLEMPVTIVAGAEDSKYATIAHQMADEIGANAEVRVVSGAGHQLLEHAPELVRSLLLKL